jgi:hypothetical protein
MTPHEHLERLNAELKRFHSEYPDMHAILRVSETGLSGCSKWKWEQHGWKVNDSQVCGIMNGNDRERRAALLSVLEPDLIRKVEFVAETDVLDILPDPSVSRLIQE